jgi:predicted O-linked N-acetylglucosamine transferase (SPINDLY family)
MNHYPAITMTARNAPCPCGSGKKFKYCHGSRTVSSGLKTPVLNDVLASLRLGQYEKALALSESIPDSIEKFRLQVQALISLRQAGHLQRALDVLAKWRLLQPQSIEAVQRQLEIHLNRRQFDQAKQCLLRCPGAERSPSELKYFSAVLEQLTNHIEPAVGLYAAAIRQQRQESQLPALDAESLEVAAVMQLCETAAGNYPGAPGKSDAGMFGSGTELNLLENALLNWQQSPASAIAPQELKSVHANAWYNLGCAALADFTADDRRIGLFEKAIELDPDHLLARFNRAFAYNYSFSADLQQIYCAHQEAGEWLRCRSDPLDSAKFTATSPSSRIRLAYLSADIRKHSVAHFILPVLQQHDHEHFEIFVYYNHRHEDELSHAARSHVEHFYNVSQLNDNALKELIRSHQVDILVDLNGLTEHHRLAVLADRVAPIQLNWIGYPNTTGLAQMDFRIIDNLTDPVGQSEAFCSETLLRLPAPFLCFAPLAELPDVVPPPFAGHGFITFGSFNSFAKLNPPLIANWASILRQLPDSRLLIKNLGMDYERPRKQVGELFASLGIAIDRLTFAGKTITPTDHLKFYGQVDICLDSFPYNGTTTTCDSLLMGVPVVSRAGNDHRSRVGLSLLSALELEYLVASDEDSLVRIVTDLTSKPQQLHNLRSELRSKLVHSSLGDAASLTANLERELIRIWNKRLHNQGTK